MSRAVLSIGSNVGDRLARLRSVVDALAGHLVAVSPVYETPPWGPVAQDDYLNAVVVVDDPGADARAWLERAHALERAAGREHAVRWGPRTLDVDIVQVVDGDAVRSSDPDLTLPHPRAHERAFVLVPWADVDPEAVLAGQGRVADLAATLPAGERAGVRRRDDLTLAAVWP